MLEIVEYKEEYAKEMSKIIIDNIYVLRIRKNYIQNFWFSTEDHIGDHYEKS